MHWRDVFQRGLLRGVGPACGRAGLAMAVGSAAVANSSICRARRCMSSLASAARASCWSPSNPVEQPRAA